MKKAAIGRGSLFLSLLLPLALAGCGSGGDTDDPFVDSVVSTIEADCLRTAPSAPAAAQQRQHFCTCLSQRIRASGIKAAAGDKANDERIRTAQKACHREVYGKG
ncbi:MAG TPA: hypothetical protein VFW19_06915 [Allosphingosinicella sp.]|nr:hypothetical protein [Allosphingosinicella sp.]